MEVFSLLKYWKGGGGGVSSGCSNSSTASFAASAGEHADDDDGPFFDLDFADNGDVFHKLGRENEVIQEGDEEEEEEENDVVGGIEWIKSGLFPKSDSPIRTARKLRMLMLRLKRSKSDSISTTTSQTPNHNQHNDNNSKNKNVLRVKFNAEVSIVSLLSRATSNSKVNTEQQAHESCNDERMNKRESVQKYLKMMKRVSKRQQAAEAAAMTAAIKRLNLRKSKSAVVVPNNMASKRRDDSLLQQEDGIQSAILHCKRSFNASRGMYLRSDFPEFFSLLHFWTFFLFFSFFPPSV